jgi:hypothetical protein
VDVDLSANNFTFDPSGLAAGNYVVGVEVSDDGVPVQSSTATLIMEVVAPPSTTSSSNSTNAASSGGGSLNIFALLITCLIGFIRRCPA